MSQYLTIPLQVNAEALITETYERMEAAFPGWEAKPANPEAALIRSMAYVMVQPLAQLATDVADEIFYRYGEEIVGVKPKEQTHASGKVKITFKDTAGYEIPAGYEINMPKTGSNLIGFRTTAVAVAAPGASSATNVPVEAIEPGLEGNSLVGVAQPVDAIAYVTTVEMTTETSGGEEAEESSVYLSRLVETMQTLAPRPILARDVAILARSVSGVFRAAVRDNYKVTTNESGLEKTTSVAVANAEGKDPGETVRNAVAALLSSRREANYQFFVAPPNLEEIDVKATLVEATGFSHAEALAQCKAALERLLNPALFATGPSAEPTIWEYLTLLRFQDFVTVVNNCQAVDHYTVLETRKHGGTYSATADITMTGAFPLPVAKEITLT